MALKYSSYYGLTRVTDSGPEVKNWAVTDSNVQTTSLILKSLEQHTHLASTPMRYPGYNTLNPATPATPLLTLSSTGGFIQAGVTVGVRFSFLNNIGLETEASPETFVQTPAVVIRPNAPNAAAPVSTPVPGAVQGGTFIYALTKRMGTGESQLSDVTTVDVPFTTTAGSSFTVPLTFDPINSYVDGTDSLCLYRSTGFDNSFVLVTALTATPGRQNASTSYTDVGSIQDSTQQPPQGSEFGKQNSLNIKWNNLIVPSDAYYVNIYLTQQAGIWGTQNLFQSYFLKDPATPAPTQINYQGIEILSSGYPQEFTQIPNGASLIYLTTQSYGGYRLSEPADALGWPTYNFRFPDQAHATPMFGVAYVDSSIGGNGQLKVCLSTPSGPGNPGIFTTLAGVGSGYAHPLAEAGGHVASHIYAAPTGIGGPTQDQLNSIFSTPVAGGPGRYRIQATTINKIAATPMGIQNSVVGTYVSVPSFDTISQFPNGLSPDFAGQWFEVTFQCNANHVLGAGQTAQYTTMALNINGSQIVETIRSFGSPFTNIVGQPQYGTVNISFATPITRSNNRFFIQNQLSFPGYNLIFGTQTSFVIKELF